MEVKIIVCNAVVSVYSEGEVDENANMNENKQALRVLKAVATHSDRRFRTFKNLPLGSYLVRRFEIHKLYKRNSDDEQLRVCIHLDDYTLYLPERFVDFLNNSLLIDGLNKEPSIVMTYAGDDPNQPNEPLLDFDVVALDVDEDIF